MIFAENLSVPEGPVVLADGSWLVVEMGPDRGCVTKLGEDGNLYVTVYGQGDVTVLSADGSVAGRIQTAGKLPTNVAFGLPGEQRIYVTEVEFGRVEAFEVNADGLRLYS